MSKSNDRGRIILGALVQISQLSDAWAMKRIALDALIEIGVIRRVEDETVLVKPQ